jgi:membrane-associated phospholipid phosphatase
MTSINKLLFVILVLMLSVSAVGQNTDIRWLDKINGPVNTSKDKCWKFVSNTVTPVNIATPLSMFATGLVTHNKDLQKRSYYTAASLLLAAGLSTSFKVIIRRPRPFTTYPDIITKKGNGGSFSFPSGHTTMAFATATSLSLSFPKWYVIVPSYTYAAAVAYSRMYLGVHYPSDILGGIILGIGTSFLVFESEKWLSKK